MRDWGEHIQSSLPGIAVEEGVPLRQKTTFRIGGPARWCITVQTGDQLRALIRECTREGLPWFLLGGGSNVLFSDRGFDGVVIVNQVVGIKANSLECVETGAGVELMELVSFAEARGLAGCEALAGIPGSVGGAVVGNAGAYGRNIGELIESVDLITSAGGIERVTSDNLEFGYRESRLKRSKDAILSVRLRLGLGDRERISGAIRETLALRAEKHPPHGAATAGSFFKNLPPETPGGRRIAAGLILDQAGARGLSCGDAYVFEKHANIVVNRGQASARDVLELTERMKQLAYSHAGVILEEEVRRIGFAPDELRESHSGKETAG